MLAFGGRMKNRIFLLSRIIITFIFLIFSTYIWFNFQDFKVYNANIKENIYVSENIEFSSLKQVSDQDSLKLQEYVFQIINQDCDNQNIKIAIVPNIINNNISNNYLKYTINNSAIHSLNMDGIIYIDNIKINEVKDISLKIWISDTYKGTLNYSGRVIII